MRHALKAIVAVLLIPMLLPFAFWYWGGFPVGGALQVCGIVTTLIGTLWLAAGVYISHAELEAITNVKVKRAITMVHDALASASRPVGLASLYLLVGAAILIWDAVDTARKIPGF